MKLFNSSVSDDRKLKYVADNLAAFKNGETIALFIRSCCDALGTGSENAGDVNGGDCDCRETQAADLRLRTEHVCNIIVLCITHLDTSRGLGPSKWESDSLRECGKEASRAPSCANQEIDNKIMFG